ncbi:transcription factor TFIIIB component B'' homolog isoform X2 [Labrus mixtus]|uniref:transcription factor TFIIIB component B'' homolog isoform X2 n=1 Tax=Labrus mixtus TaxID=508554 RepID=UPI0029C0388C|nr:transcription factor TFIIIB component B'' homolog isoform X2 [Labrus mixtus]
MFRRSRFSVRPNVGTAGRTAATPQEAPSASQEAGGETPKDVSESCTTDAAVTENKSEATPSEKPTSTGDGNDQNGEGTSSSAAVQRRKRFSIKPKVAPGRLSTLSRTPKSPAKAVAETSISDLDKPTTSSQPGTPTSPRGLQSPRRRRSSEDSRQPKVQPKAVISSDTSGPLADPSADDSQEQTHLPADSGKQLESTSDGPVKKVSFAQPDKVQPSLTDKEATEISEKARTLVSSKGSLSVTSPAFSLSRLLNDPSDMQRIAKAQKLRELLRQEMHREKEKKKIKVIKKEFSLDPAKMTMRDLIRYMPESNPMTSSLEETVIENETVIPPSPAREASPERVKEPEPVPEITSPREEEEEGAQEEDGENQEDQDDSLMVPQVKVAEDGTLIIDEESLTVEVLRAKGPNPANDRDPIFERGSTTTYASFRKPTYSKPWSSEETDMFFLAISMVGTDFSMICQLFPHRSRSEIKNKFKKEERENSWRVDKAFRERRKLDIEYFSKLLEKILEVQKTRKKLKSVTVKNSPKKEKKKRKSRKNSKKLSDVEEEDEDNENSLPDLEGEGEKENEDLCNEGGAEVSKLKKKRKRKSDASKEEPKDKKNKAGKKDKEQDDSCIPEDTEAALPAENTNSDMSEKSGDVNAAKDTTIKPAKLSRGKAPKPLLPLGRKWGKKPPKASTKAGDAASDKGDESEIEGTSEEQLNKDASPLKQANKKSDNDDNSSEEEETTVQPVRPTRYGRVPKPTKPLNYPAREDAHSSASESTSASSARPEPKPPAKRGRTSKAQSAQESKKPKLVTLRATQSDYSDEDNDEQWEEQVASQPACGSSNDSNAPAFVPASLRSPHPMMSEVEETMEEDVIEFLSSEHSEVTEDESYNEAAQTLLTIGNLAHLSQPDQNQLVTPEQTTETISVNLSEASPHLEEEIASMPYAQEENSATPFMSATSGHGITETSETTLELQSSTTDDDGLQSSNQQTGTDVDPTTKLHASPEGSKKDSTPAKRGRLSKVKPKPNLGRASRAAQSQSQPDTSIAEQSHTDSPNLVQATGILSAAEEIPEVVSHHEDMLKDDNVHLSCSDVKFTEKQSGRQERSDAATSGPETQIIKDSGDSWSTDVMPESRVWTTQSSTNNLVTSDTAVQDLQIGLPTNVDSASVQESSEHLASGVTSVEDLPDSQKQESRSASPPKTGISRFQKVKPKPNLAKSSRAVRSKPQTTKETVEKDPNPSPNIEIPSAEPTSLEKPGQGLVSDSSPSLEFGPALTLSEEIPKMDKKKTVVGLVGGEDNLGMTTLHQDSSENQNVSVAPSSTEQAAEETKPTPKSTEGGGGNQLKSDTVVTESQGSNKDSAPVVPAEVLPVSQKQDNEGASTCKTTISRFQKVKPKPNVAQTSRAVRSKPQTTKETVEEQSQPTQNPDVHEKTIDVFVEQTCIPLTENPREGVGLAPDLMPSSVPGTSLAPTEEMTTIEREKKEIGAARCQFEPGSATFDQRPTESQISSEAQFDTNQTTRDTTSTSQPKVQDLVPHVGTTESSSRDLQTCVVTESSGDQGSNIDSVKHDFLVSQKHESEDASSPQTRRSRFQRFKPKPNVALTSRTVRPKPQTTSNVVEKDSIEIPKPTLQEETKVEFLGQPACRTSPEKTSECTGPAPDDVWSLDLGFPPSPKDNVSINEEKKTDVQDLGGGTVPPGQLGQNESTVSALVSKSSLESRSTQKASEDLSSTEEPVTDVGLDSGSEGSQQSVAQGRRRVPRVKPNIGSSTRARQTQMQSDDTSKPSQQCHKDIPENNSQQRELESTDRDSKDLKTTQCSLHTELLSSTKSAESVDILNDKAVSSSADDSVLENKTTEKSNVEWDKMPTSDKVEAGPAAHWDLKQDTFIEAIETNTQPTEIPISDAQSSEGGSAESQIKSYLPTNNQSTSDSEGSTQLPKSQCQEVQQYPEANQTTAQSTPKDHLEQTDSSKSRRDPLSRRGRYVKPKPNLGRSRQPPQSQQVQDAEQAEADSVPTSEGVDASVSHGALPELQPDIQEQVEEALSQLSSQNLPPTVAGASFGCVSEAQDHSTQDAPLPSTEESFSDPSFSIFPDMLSGQMPSDSEEKFIILSLIEIPVCQQEEMLQSVPEPLPCPPVTEASIQQRSVPAECSTATGVESLSSAALTVSMEESEETGLINAKDSGSNSTTCTGSVPENQGDPQESTTVQTSTLPETVEGTEETETPPTKQKLQGTTRRAKRQVKPNTSRKQQASTTVTAEEEEESPPLQTNTTEESELPGLSVQPRESDEQQQKKKGGSRKEGSKKAPTGSKDAEESSSARPTRVTRNRNPKGSLPETNNTAPPSCSTPARATSKAQKVKTPRAARKQSAPESEASTSHEVAPTFSSVETLEEQPLSTSLTELNISQTFDFGQGLDPGLTPSQSFLDVFSSQQSLDLDGSSIEEATSVSQYFLSDIFTDVEEG